MVRFHQMNDLRPWLIGAAASVVAAVLAAGIVLMWEATTPPPSKHQARMVVEPLPPSNRTPQQRIDEAWEALRAHSRGYR